MPEQRYTPELIVWGSGGGSTYRAMATAIGEGLVPPIDIPLVISDREDAGIIGQVDAMNKRYGTDTEVTIINQRRYPGGPAERGQTQQEGDVTCGLLQQHSRATLALMGCLRILHTQVMEEFGWNPGPAAHTIQATRRSRIINTHPGILPATRDTYGIHTQRKVIELGLTQTAQTLSVVGGAVDAGPVINEHRIDVPTYDRSTAASREHAAEHLFGLVRSVEQSHLPFDVAAFLIEQRNGGYV